MTLEDQVCTLEQAKRLRELLGQIDSMFSYLDGHLLYKAMRYDYSAFTVAELGVMIGDDNDFNVYTHDGSAAIYLKQTNRCIAVIHSVHEAHIRGQMLIYKLENKFITAEEVNERLNVKTISNKEVS